MYMYVYYIWYVLGLYVFPLLPVGVVYKFMPTLLECHLRVTP